LEGDRGYRLCVSSLGSQMAKHGDVRIGISGWRYRPWRGVFYPEQFPQRRELAFAAENFSAVEINGTFYSLRRPESFERWASEVPADFRFAVKGSRFITHNKKLKDIERPLANFFAQGVLELGAKLGPFLWQFSPRFRFDADRLSAFFALLPRDTDDAARLARRHDHRVTGRATLKPKATPGFGTRSRSGTRALSTRPSSSCCAGMTWRSSAPTQWTGRD
jgi:uncharacterized protein YecE (DUF72 family)